MSSIVRWNLKNLSNQKPKLRFHRHRHFVSRSPLGGMLLSLRRSIMPLKQSENVVCEIALIFFQFAPGSAGLISYKREFQTKNIR